MECNNEMRIYYHNPSILLVVVECFIFKSDSDKEKKK